MGNAAHLERVASEGADRLGIGGNGPPEPTLYEAAKAKVDDIAEEAAMWLDGADVESPEQADGLALIRDLAMKARKQADEARKVENEPFDTGKAEVQARFNPLLKDADRIKDAVNAALLKWQAKQDAILRAAAVAERAKADAAAEIARKARATMDAANLANVAEVERQTAASDAAQEAARRAENAKVVIKGGARAVSFKTVYDAVVTERRQALNYYAVRDPAALTAWIQSMADVDARGARGTVPGVQFVPRKVAA